MHEVRNVAMARFANARQRPLAANVCGHPFHIVNELAAVIFMAVVVLQLFHHEQKNFLHLRSLRLGLVLRLG